MFHILLSSLIISAIPPSINLSDIHSVYCEEVVNGMKYDYEGTGFLIANGVLATAHHISSGEKCEDVNTGGSLVQYRTDVHHDFGLMTGPKEVGYGPYIRYSCSRPVVNADYISYGWSPFDMPDFYKPILRNNHLVATSEISKTPIADLPYSIGMRTYSGTPQSDAPGMSGGPIADLDGTVVSFNSAGNGSESFNYDLADTALCTGQWD